MRTNYGIIIYLLFLLIKNSNETDYNPFNCKCLVMRGVYRYPGYTLYFILYRHHFPRVRYIEVKYESNKSTLVFSSFNNYYPKTCDEVSISARMCLTTGYCESYYTTKISFGAKFQYMIQDFTIENISNILTFKWKLNSHCKVKSYNIFIENDKHQNMLNALTSNTTISIKDLTICMFMYIKFLVFSAWNNYNVETSFTFSYFSIIQLNIEWSTNKTKRFSWNNFILCRPYFTLKIFEEHFYKEYGTSKNFTLVELPTCFVGKFQLFSSNILLVERNTNFLHHNINASLEYRNFDFQRGNFETSNTSFKIIRGIIKVVLNWTLPTQYNKYCYWDMFKITADVILSTNTIETFKLTARIDNKFIEFPTRPCYKICITLHMCNKYLCHNSSINLCDTFYNHRPLIISWLLKTDKVFQWSDTCEAPEYKMQYQVNDFVIVEKILNTSEFKLDIPDCSEIVIKVFFRNYIVAYNNSRDYINLEENITLSSSYFIYNESYISQDLLISTLYWKTLTHNNRYCKFNYLILNDYVYGNKGELLNLSSSIVDVYSRKTKFHILPCLYNCVLGYLCNVHRCTNKNLTICNVFFKKSEKRYAYVLPISHKLETERIIKINGSANMMCVNYGYQVVIRNLITGKELSLFSSGFDFVIRNLKLNTLYASSARIVIIVYPKNKTTDLSSSTIFYTGREDLHLAYMSKPRVDVDNTVSFEWSIDRDYLDGIFYMIVRIDTLNACLGLYRFICSNCLQKDVYSKIMDPTLLKNMSLYNSCNSSNTKTSYYTKIDKDFELYMDRIKVEDGKTVLKLILITLIKTEVIINETLKRKLAIEKGSSNWRMFLLVLGILVCLAILFIIFFIVGLRIGFLKVSDENSALNTFLKRFDCWEPTDENLEKKKLKQLKQSNYKEALSKM